MWCGRGVCVGLCYGMHNGARCCACGGARYGHDTVHAGARIAEHGADHAALHVVVSAVIMLLSRSLAIYLLSHGLA